MRKFDILDPNLDIFQSYFLEASAGTGKTFAIENLIIRLLLESPNPIHIQEILAVTFTREAAFEMKERIRTKLESLRDQNSDRVKEALIYFDEAQIFTIHGFCHRMLKEFAFEAKTPFQSDSSDHHQTELKQTIEDFFRTGNKIFSAEVGFLLKKTRTDLDRLVYLIAQEVEKENEVEPARWIKPQQVSMKSLKQDLYTLAPRYKRFKPENYEGQVETLVHCLEKQHFQPLLDEKQWFFERMHEANAKVKAVPLSTLSLNHPGLFETLRAQVQKERDPKLMIKRLAHECAKRWKEKSLRKDLYTPDSLLAKMRDLLDQKVFVSRVREKYQAVIIDEFQDTDSIQWEIFERLFAEKWLYLVGDPKQSIYGFRNADIYTYMRAGDLLGEERKAYLDTNYRSSPNLVAALNRLFTKHPNWIQLPSLPNALSYHPVKAGRTENHLEEPPIQFFLVEGAIGRERSWPTKELEEKKLFPYIASEILRLHQQKKIPFSEIALLVKDRFQGQRLHHHLNLWNIPSAIKRTLNLAESPGFLAIEDLIRFLSHPKDEALMNGVLCGPLFGFSSGDIEGKAKLSKLAERFQEEGLAVVFEELPLKNPPLLLQCRQTIELLLQEDSGNLLHVMSELKKFSPEEDERLKLKSGDGADKVAIMTTFASKGLEFEIVFALGMASRHYSPEIDQEKDAEKMRQLYVAFTRAREKLYIPLLFDFDNRAKTAPIEQFFSSWGDNLVLELEKLDFATEWIGDIPITPYVQHEEKQLEKTALPVSFDFPVQALHSFSSLAKPVHKDERLTDLYLAQDLNEKTLHTLPLGAQTGTLVHTIFEKIFAQRTLPFSKVVSTSVANSSLEGWEDVLTQLAEDVMTMPLFENFALQDLSPGDYFEEMEFLYSENRGLIKGFADLVFQHERKYYLLDWKTNWLGPDDESYTEEVMRKAMEEHDYFLQAKLYTQALKKYVKLIDSRSFESCFGGVVYVFLRGKQAFHF